MSAIGLPGPFELLIILALGGGTGLPLGIPPLPEDPVLGRVAPEECLFYTSWAGTAEPNPDSPNQTEQLLAEPEVQTLVAQIERLIRVGLSQAIGREGPEVAKLAEDGFGWAKTLLSRPAAVFISSASMTPAGPDVRGGVVVNVGDGVTELKASLTRHQQLLGPAVEPIEILGETWYRITLPAGLPQVTWGTRAEYLIAGIGEGAVDDVLRDSRTGPPAWLTEIARQLPVGRRATVSYINVKAILGAVLPIVGRDPRVGTVLDALGLTNVTSVASVTGLDESGFLSQTLVGLDGPPAGLLGVVTDGFLGPADLAPIPRDATIALAAKMDADRILQAVLSLVGQVEPGASEEVLAGFDEVEDELGVDVRRDVLGSLGDTWRVYNAPSEGGLVITGLTAVVSVDEPGKLAESHAKLLARVKRDVQRDPEGPRVEQFQFAGRDVYFFNARDDDFPLAPAWCLTDDSLVVAPFPQNIKAHLSRDDRYESLVEVPEVAGLFGSDGGPAMMSYVDNRSLFDLIYPFIPMLAQAGLSKMQRELEGVGIDVNVSLVPSAAAIRPHLRPGVSALRRTSAGIEFANRQSIPGGNVGSTVPVMVAFLLPAVGSAREAARRMHSTNNLKHIGIALHNYHDVHGHFPAAYSTDAEGQPLLSWRVQILPYIEQEPLYGSFHLDEPWDSEHNRRLASFVPGTFRSPGSTAEPVMTNYLGVRGENSVFPGKEPIQFSDIKDGTSNTIMVVEVKDEASVIWTKPDDFQPDPDNPIAGLVGLRPGGFNALFCDASVRFISQNIDAGVLKLLFTRNDGQPIDQSELD